MRLKNDVAIVTGAGRGIGASIAKTFAAEGAQVVVADLDGDNAARISDEICRAGGQAIAERVDVSEPAEVQRLIDRALGQFQRLDVLVNNAGIGLNKPLLTTTLEEWELQLRVNLTGTFLCGQAAARAMVERGGGRIINIASISGQRGGQGRAAYGAAKAGVILLTKVMAVELAPLRVRVNAVSPGPVDTDQSRGTHTPSTRQAYYERIPAQRYGEREEIAAAALFLATHESSFVNGHVLNVDGGFNAAGLIFEDSDSKQMGQPPAQRGADPTTEQRGRSAAAGNGAAAPAQGHAT
jgi:NAD(P)-dependent dehydrogenase (short-subunit alcohol dehydrogenase family)